jgi:hypothetical protein
VLETSFTRTATQVFEMAKQKSQKKEIDYLHPDGKPTKQTDNRPPVFNAEREAQENANRNKAIEEADGHHVCSSSCQSHHEVKAKGADKTKP